MTCSPSFLRISPWSTNTHVSWSPIARCTSSAATDESTPPRQAADDLAVADLLADARDLLLDDRGRRPRHVAAADVAQEALEDVLPVGRVDDLGVELDAVDAALDATRTPRRATAVDEASAREARAAARRPCRGATSSRSARPAARRSSRPVLVDGELGAAELADLGALDPAAELEREQLHAVADAQHRDAELEQLGIELRRAVGVHRRRAAGEDQALGLAPRGPPRRRRGAAAARRTRRTRARGAR